MILLDYSGAILLWLHAPTLLLSSTHQPLLLSSTHQHYYSVVCIDSKCILYSSVSLGFVVDKLALGYFFSEYFSFVL